MDDIHYTFRMLALSQALLICLYHLLYQRNAIGWLIALNSFAFACYLVMPFAGNSVAPSLLVSVGILITSSIPAFLWLLAKRFLEDDESIPKIFWLAWIGYMILWVPGWEEMDHVTDPAINDILFNLLPQVIKLGFVAHVIYMALAGTRA